MSDEMELKVTLTSGRSFTIEPGEGKTGRAEAKRITRDKEAAVERGPGNSRTYHAASQVASITVQPKAAPNPRAVL